jgi:hypothetical protein
MFNAFNLHFVVFVISFYGNAQMRCSYVHNDTLIQSINNRITIDNYVLKNGLFSGNWASVTNEVYRLNPNIQGFGMLSLSLKEDEVHHYDVLSIYSSVDTFYFSMVASGIVKESLPFKREVYVVRPPISVTVSDNIAKLIIEKDYNQFGKYIYCYFDNRNFLYLHFSDKNISFEELLSPEKEWKKYFKDGYTLCK